jgi:hypothetical protein
MVEEVKESATPEEGIGSGEHDKAMIEKSDQTIEQAVQEKVDKQEATPAKAEERPEWLPEKYKTVEDFLEGHKSLEKKLGEREEATPTDKSESEEGDKTPEQTEESQAGPLDPYYAEYSEKGGLSEESYAALKELGYTPDVVDTYIKGYEAQVQQYTTEAHELVGGAEEYQAMTEWAVDNLSAEQLDAYNDQLYKGGENWELALRGLHAKYKASDDAPIERVESGDKGQINKGVQPFTSQEELTTATTDKRYKTSPEYRKMVEDRLAISDDATMGANIPNPYAAHG